MILRKGMMIDQSWLIVKIMRKDHIESPDTFCGVAFQWHERSHLIYPYVNNHHTLMSSSYTHIYKWHCHVKYCHVTQSRVVWSFGSMGTETEEIFCQRFNLEISIVDPVTSKANAGVWWQFAEILNINDNNCSCNDAGYCYCGRGKLRVQWHDC